MICEENVERTHDENERSAMVAIMNAAASRGKGKKGKLPDLADLYKRPSEEEMKKAPETVEDIREQQAHTEEWLSQFDLSMFDED